MDTDRIKSKEEFLLFVEKLRNDFEENSQDWENEDLASYLESMKAWVEDTDNSYFEGNVWTVISRIVLAPKYYE